MPFGIFLIGLWLIGFLTFTLYPLIQSFYYSLSKASIGLAKINVEFIKFANYRYLFLSDSEFPI